MTEFLLEIYSEEIPARMQENAAREIAAKISGEAKYFYTPQRIVVVADLPEKQEDIKIDKRGPRVGSPDQALQGFLKSVGLTKIEEAEIREIKNEKYYYYKNTVKGEATAEFLAKKLPEILSNFTWPKSMRWGSGEIKWVRPLHSILCIFGGKIVPFTFGHIKSGNATQGHRFLSAKQFAVSSKQQYFDELKQNKVVVDAAERKKIIWEAAKKTAGNLSLREDEKLLSEVANLVEWPVILLGEFDKDFLSVPQECLIATMKNNQKYFPLFDGEKLSNKFIVVANKEDVAGKIIAGNERVIKARLSDAKFFWDQDRKIRLEDMAPKLKTVTFHAKIGTIYEKTRRMGEIAMKIAKIIGASPAEAQAAAFLSKADLVSGMVGEFAELQGIMGRYYATLQNQPQEIADAIRDHYQPVGQDDSIPTAPISICVALADKIDSLVTLWEAGEKPTGSGDPYGLRRAALGIIRIILGNNLKISIKTLITNKEVFEFLIDRMKHLLKTQNIRHDYIAAALDGKTDDLVSIKSKAEALGKFIETPSGKNLLESYKRAANILAIEEKKDKTTYLPSPEKSLLAEAEEKDLFAKIESATPQINHALGAENYAEAMNLLSALQPAVNAFFEKVTVNAKEADLRQNRLKLLAKIRVFINLIADFSKIEG